MRQVRRAFHSAGDGRLIARGDTYQIGVGEEGIDLASASGSGAAHFGIARVSRQGLALPSIGSVEIAADGSLTRVADAYVERLALRPEGLEQTWTFPRMPRGAGDLTIHVPVTGVAFDRATEEGLQFAANARPAVRYGHATWVDAAGVQTRLLAHWDHGAIALTVPEALLAGSRYPAVLDPILSPEWDASTPVQGPAHDGQFDSAIAFNGTNYLVVWEDNRLGAPGDGWPQVFGTRVSPDGTVLDPVGLQWSAGYPVSHPAVTAVGADFFVAWIEGPTSGIDGGKFRISGAWWRANNSTPSPPAAISTAFPSGSAPSLALGSNGSSVLLAWDPQSSPVVFTLVANDGTVLQPAGTSVPLDADTFFQGSPSVASDGASYLIAWYETRLGDTGSAYGVRVDASGQLTDSSAAPLLASSYPPALTFGGGHYLVSGVDSGGNVVATLVSPDRTVATPGGFTVASSPSGWSQLPGTASFNGTDFLIAWERHTNDGTGFQVAAARVAASGTVIDASALVLASGLAGTDQSQLADPRVASNGTDFWVTWTRTLDPAASYEALDVVGRRVSSDGTLGSSSEVLLSAAASLQTSPAIAFNGSEYLVAWVDERDNAVMATRVAVDGTILDAAGVHVVTLAGLGATVQVASNGTGFLVVWGAWNGTSYGVRGARVASDGTVLDASAIALSAASQRSFEPQVTSDGSDYLVVWKKEGIPGTDPEIVYGARVRASDGAALDGTGKVIASSLWYLNQPQIAYGDGAYLVAWWSRTGGGSGWVNTIAASRITPAGQVLDPSGLTIDAEAGGAPAVAFGDGEFLVSFHANHPPAGVGTYGVRVTPAGLVLDAQARFLSPADQVWASVHTGNGFVLLTRSFEVIDPSFHVTSNQLALVRVGTSGASCDPDGGVVVDEDMVSTPVPGAMSFAAANHARLAYSRFDPTAGAVRVKLRDVEVNRAPVAGEQSLSTPINTPVSVSLSATDDDGDALTYDIVTPPMHGSLSGTAPDLIYTPASDPDGGYTGTDEFSFIARDCMEASAPATVTIEVGGDPGDGSDGSGDGGADGGDSGGCCSAAGRDEPPIAVLVLFLAFGWVRRIRRRIRESRSIRAAGA